MYYVGIDMGGTTIKGGIISQHKDIPVKESFKSPYNDTGGGIQYDKRILIKDSIATPKEYKNILGAIRTLINNMLDEINVPLSAIEGIGIGSPGVIDSNAGVIKYSNNIRLDNIHIIEDLKKFLKCKIKLINDANAAMIGEWLFGAARGYGSSILLTLGTGVGVGIIIDGKIVDTIAPGHMIIEKDGKMCTCGNNGCLEAYASATSLIRDTKEAMVKNVNSLMWQYTESDIGNADGRTAFNAARKGDASAESVIDKFIKNLGSGIISFANILNPEIVLIGGGIAKEGDYLISRLTACCKGRVFGGRDVNVDLARLGNDAGIWGSAGLFLIHN